MSFIVALILFFQWPRIAGFKIWTKRGLHILLALSFNIGFGIATLLLINIKGFEFMFILAAAAYTLAGFVYLAYAIEKIRVVWFMVVAYLAYGAILACLIDWLFTWLGIISRVKSWL